jgi:hypothetical protein
MTHTPTTRPKDRAFLEVATRVLGAEQANTRLTALQEAHKRRRQILDAQAAIRKADGPDEREAAQARLNALLDGFEAEDAAALAEIEATR